MSHYVFKNQSEAIVYFAVKLLLIVMFSVLSCLLQFKFQQISDFVTGFMMIVAICFFISIGVWDFKNPSFRYYMRMKKGDFRKSITSLFHLH